MGSMIKLQSQTFVSGFVLLPLKGSGIHCNPGYAGQGSIIELLLKRREELVVTDQ